MPIFIGTGAIEDAMKNLVDNIQSFLKNNFAFSKRNKLSNFIFNSLVNGYRKKTDHKFIF
jgi:hypothetical protein